MYANICPPHGKSQNSPGHQRLKASACVSFKHDGSRTKLDRLYQHASAKIRFPKNRHDPVETVLINTAGGLTGGDRLSWSIDLGRNAQVVATTQACEKAYRSSTGAVRVVSSMRVGEGACLDWLPQETILYNGSNLSRQFDVDLASDASLLAMESIVLGRDASGEVPANIQFKDKWRVKREGRLIFADDLCLTETANSLAQLQDHRVLSTLVYCSPRHTDTLEEMAQKLREKFSSKLTAFSAFDGKLTCRILCQSSYELRQVLYPVLEHIRGTGLPRVWRI